MKKLIVLLSILTLLAAGCAARRTDPVAGGAPVAVSEAAGAIRAADHTHTPAETPQTVSATPMGPTCGNTETTIQPCDAVGAACGNPSTFMFEDSVRLTALLLELDYSPARTCKCVDYQYVITTEFGGPYYVSLRSAYARCAAADGALAQADLTEEQLQELQEIIERQVN